MKSVTETMECVGHVSCPQRIVYRSHVFGMNLYMESCIHSFIDIICFGLYATIEFINVAWFAALYVQ